MNKSKWNGVLFGIVIGISLCTRVQPTYAQVHTIYNTKMPSVIRVAVRENNDPRGRILWVQTLGFQEYCEDVLPNEWMPSWERESLRAGAMAIKMFGWFHSMHPVTIDGQTFDVDNTVNFQEFKYKSGTFETNQAIRELWPYAYTSSSGEIIELDYRAGIPRNPNWEYRGADRMAQWGSQYWAARRRTYLSILQFYYTDLGLNRIP